METMLMEADSTSGGGGAAASAAKAQTVAGEGLAKQPRNIEFFDSHILPNSAAGREEELALWLQARGLLPTEMRCTGGRAECRMLLRQNARSADKLRWWCGACQRGRPLRTRSFFAHIDCSVVNVLKILLAWSEDRHHETVARNLGVKVGEALAVYERVESAVCAAAAAVAACAGAGRLCGVVLAEMYPACLPHRSPDSSDTHHHRILMLADTSTVPTRYYLHVMSGNKAEKRKSSNRGGSESAEVSAVCERVCEQGSVLVTGAAVPAVRAHHLSHVLPLQRLTQHADADFTRFLGEGIWRQAVTLCAASRDVCGEGAGARCGAAVQRYLHVALHRLRHDADGFYPRVLATLARHYAPRFTLPPKQHADTSKKEENR